MHLGLIGGIGPAATEFYYRGLVRGHAALNKSMELTIVHADPRDLRSNSENRNPGRQAEIFLEFVRRLKAAGADAAVITSLAGHFCIRELEAESPLPILSAIPILNDYFANANTKKVGLLGTRTVLESRLYGGVSSVEFVLPQGEDLDATHTNYIEIALSGQVSDSQRDFFLSLGDKLCREQGADVVALAGTDLFLVFDGIEASFDIIDCAQVHIDALVAASTASPQSPQHTMSVDGG